MMNLKTFSLAKLSVEQVDEALQNGGYLDNRLLSVAYAKRDILTFVYFITYKDGNEVGRRWCYVTINEDGIVVADF